MLHPYFRTPAVIRCWALMALLAAFPFAGFAASTVANPTPFTEATVTEVVNDVSISPASDPSTKQPATQGMAFKAPDIIQTGRRSRAQLTSADGTVARIGSNTVFSLEANSRTINLKEGSVLFNSPKGIGGGTIVTNSATATVTGTTIIVTATPDGGFKLLVLEGTATMKLANGQTITISAGQMSFVLPTSKGGGAGPVLNFDLKQQAQNSSLVNGFTVTLPSQNLIVDATQLQQQKIQSGQLTETGQVVAPGTSAEENSVVLATVNTVDTVPTAPPSVAFPDLTLGQGPFPAANTFTTPLIITAAQLGLPSGILPGNSKSFTGLIANNVKASGSVDLESIDKLSEADVLALTNFTFTESSQSSLKAPDLAGSGSPPSGGSGSPHTPSDTRFFTDFSGLTSTLNLSLIADKGFQIPQFVETIQAAISPSVLIKSYVIDIDFDPTTFNTPDYFDDLASPGLKTSALATPTQPDAVNIPTFLTQFSMISLLTDMDVTNLFVDDDNETGNVQLGSILGNVSGTDGRVEAGQDVKLSSQLGGINLTDIFLKSGENDGASSNITLVAGVGNIVLNSLGNLDEENSFIETSNDSPYNGTLTVVTPANISISNTTIESKTQNLIAGGTLTVTNSNINNGSDYAYGTTYTYAADTVKLSNLAFTGCSTLNLYSLNGTLNTNTSIVIPGDVNLQGNVTDSGSDLTHCSFGTSNIPAIGLTSDNSTVQAALERAFVINSSTSSFDPSLVFTNVLFTPGQLGEAAGDTYFAVVHGFIAGAVTIDGTADLSSLDSFNNEGQLAANNLAITGCVAISPPDGANNLQFFAINNISFGSGTYVYDSSSCFSLGFNAIQAISLNDTTVTDSMGTLSFNDLDGGITIANGSVVSSGSSDGSSGNLTINTQDDTAALMISNSTLSTYRGPITLESDNITIANLSTITAPCNTVTLNGGQTGITISNSTVSAGSMRSSLVNLFSYSNITITNNSTISSYTGTSELESPRIILTAAHTVNVTNSVISTSFSSTNAVDTINANNVSYNNASEINMSARTINLSNINFPTSSQIYLTSESGRLAPSPNTNANPVVGDVNFITNVQYSGHPAQNYVSTALGGSSNLENPPIHINSSNR